MDLITIKFWGTPSLIRTTLENTKKVFREEKRKYPYRDPHAWLALTYGLRPGYAAAPFVHFTRMILYSVLGENAPTALAYHFLNKENPAAFSKFEAKMKRLIAPAFRLIQEGQFFNQWQEQNPWTAGNIEGLREVVVQIVPALEKMTVGPSRRACKNV